MNGRPVQGPMRRTALLRGINLGSSRQIPMAALREVAAALGWTDLATHLRSGNLVFTSAGDDDEAARQLAAAVQEEFGLTVDVVIRSGPQLRALLDAVPFPDRDPSRVLIACCDRRVGELAARRLQALATGGERVQVADTGTDVYLDLPDGLATVKTAWSAISTIFSFHWLLNLVPKQGCTNLVILSVSAISTVSAC